MTPPPILNVNDTVLWLKVILSLLTLVQLYLRYRRAKAHRGRLREPLFGSKGVTLMVILFSFGVFHNLGTFAADSFVHHGEMFHYYLGSKYFDELGYDGLYDAVIAADTEQDNALAELPFYTDLTTYQNASRDTALAQVGRIKGQFSDPRWTAFKADVAFFKSAAGMPQSTRFFSFLMDHGYNGSPVSTLVLGTLSNAVPVTQLALLAMLDFFLVIGMGVLVLRTFGYDVGALYCVFFCINALGAHDFVSGSLLRYDWLFFLGAAACLLDRGRHASAAVCLSLAAMLRVFPAVLFVGLAVAFVRSAVATRSVDKSVLRFALAAGATALALFLLPALSLGSVIQPWKDFIANTALHDAGVYVNHLGLRAIVLFEPSHLSLDAFIETFRPTHTNDIVRHWQDLKEAEFLRKRAAILIAALLTLVALAGLIWKGKLSEIEAMVWPLLLVYAGGFPSHYYYVFLCMFVLLFFRRSVPVRWFVPLALLLVFNVCVLVTDYNRLSPIEFYTWVNLFLFAAFISILAFELHHTFLVPALEDPAPDEDALAQAEPTAKRRQPPKKRAKRARRS